MVQVLESNPTFAQQIGRSAGAALGKTGSEFAENLALKKKGIDVAGLTGYARDVAIKEGMKRAMLIQQGGRTLAPQGGQPGTEPFQGTQPTPGTPAQPGQNPPSRPSGNSQIIIPPEQIEQEAIRRGQQKLKRGEPTDLQTEIGLINQQNSNVAQYQAYQKQAGDLAEDKLTKVYDNPTSEELGYFRRKGEQLALQGYSQAEIDRDLAKQSRTFAEQIRRLDKTQGARARHKIGQTLKGTSQSDDKRRQEIRQAAKPLLDQGLYETVRTRLSKNGYGPEETESLISDLSEPTKKSLSSFDVPKPSFSQRQIRKLPGVSEDVKDPMFRTYKNNPEAQKEFASNLQQTLKSDPNANLLLLRKAYEDKGVDWNTFKTEFHNLYDDGQIELNDEQLRMLNYIEEPPLDRLDKILSNFNIIGR